ncbi:carbohydrate ABC transporter permease [Rugosimonospora africana]|uniref:ABC transporter permease n=1 Tax=Rugosimonospora africana TaxID=556532 RepID=A0A8J3QM98_9ACTN|nr:sugar ABC transporter permease [Rugosimonospora africana]GIH13201.1 ABC transporter permease [Rugosimonospora africana]
MTSTQVSAQAPAPQASVARRRRRLSRFTRRDIIILAVLIGLPVLLDIALIWGTTLTSIGLSFTDYNGFSSPQLVGLHNYHEIVTIYEPFWRAVRNNLLWLATLGVFATPLGLLLAVLLDKRIRFTRVYQSIFYMPVVLSLAVVGFIAQLVYSRDYGALNSLLGRTADPIDFLGDPSINIWAILAAAAWRHVGYVMILYLAGLKSVDPALKEAATIDGANERQTFFRVIFPTLRPINIIVLVITVIEALRAFDIVYAVNSGRNGLELLSVLVTANIVGEASRIGFGSAIAVILLVTSLGFVIAYLTQILREDRR